ncbi:MAG: hypothetical protein ACRCY9_17120 [Phycicoccus sp.]
MDDTLHHHSEPDHLGLLSDVLAAVSDVVERNMEAGPTEQPEARRHQPWCVPSQHADGDDRCVGEAFDVTPHLACWLVERRPGPRAVIDVGQSVELSMTEAGDLATALFELMDQARTSALRDGRRS